MTGRPCFAYNQRMLTPVKRRLLSVWIAMLAILFSALAPSVSHALAARASLAGFAEICTVNGVELVSLATGERQKPVKDALFHHMEHCAFCATHGGSLGLPPPLPVSFAVIGGHDLFPSLFYLAPTPLFSWSAAQPRGPPATS
jgi:hypothetical protein